MSQTIAQSKAASVAAKWEKASAEVTTERHRGRFNWTDIVFFPRLDGGGGLLFARVVGLHGYL